MSHESSKDTPNGLNYATPAWLTEDLEIVQFLECDPGDPYAAEPVPVSDPTSLAGKVVGFAVGPGTEEIELLYPLAHLRARGATVLVITPGWVKNKYHGRVPTANFLAEAHWVPVDMTIDEADHTQFDAVVVPGGAWSPITTRTDEGVLSFVRKMMAADKLVCSICHGPQVLASAGLVKGRKMTGVGDILVDLEAHGALLQRRIDGSMEPVVVDGNLITGENPNAVVAFAIAIQTYLEKRD
jgi:protease I